MSSALCNLSTSNCGWYEQLYSYNADCPGGATGSACNAVAADSDQADNATDIADQSVGNAADGTDSCAGEATDAADNISELYPYSADEFVLTEANASDYSAGDAVELGTAATEELAAGDPAEAGNLAEDGGEDALADADYTGAQINETAISSLMLCGQREQQAAREQQLREYGDAAPQQLRDDWAAWDKINADLEAKLSNAQGEGGVDNR